MTLYTDINVECCAWLGARVEDGSLPPGDVLLADIRDLKAEHLAGYSAVHLFAGIGGFPLALTWAEMDAGPWPAWARLLTGGFPCQDVSAAGKGAGLDGARSGLFWELRRVAEIYQPDVLVCENVGALSRRGLDVVAGALDKSGYLVPETYRVGAWSQGAPHERERWWIVGYRRATFSAASQPDARADGLRAKRQRGAGREPDASVSQVQPDTHGQQGRIDQPIGRAEGGIAAGWADPVTGPWRRVDDEWQYAGPPVLVYSHGAGRGQQHAPAEPGDPGQRGRRPDPTRVRGWTVPVLDGYTQHEWEYERVYQRGMDGPIRGVPGRLAGPVNRCGIMAYGNAVVPQVPAAIFGGVIRGLRVWAEKGGEVMSTNQAGHTPEPCKLWSADVDCPTHGRIPQLTGNYVTSIHRRMSDADYDRAVACVNACAGMSDPAAEIAALKARAEQAEARVAELEAYRGGQPPAPGKPPNIHISIGRTGHPADLWFCVIPDDPQDRVWGSYTVVRSGAASADGKERSIRTVRLTNFPRALGTDALALLLMDWSIKRTVCSGVHDPQFPELGAPRMPTQEEREQRPITFDVAEATVVAAYTHETEGTEGGAG